LPSLALDLLARIVAVRIDAGPPCMGSLLSSGLRAAIFLAFLIGFFVRPGIPFLRPDPQYCKAGARRSCQGWPSLQPCVVLRPCQANLDGFEPDGTLRAVALTIRGQPAFRARITRSTTLHPSRPPLTPSSIHSP